VIYELTRICLHTGVLIAEIKIPLAPKFHEWGAFWGFVKYNIAFKDKSLPERSSKEAWESGLGGIGKGFTGIVLSGSLQFNAAAAAEAPFKFRLHPIKFDLTHANGKEARRKVENRTTRPSEPLKFSDTPDPCQSSKRTNLTYPHGSSSRHL
jgi:hypothetical protein